MVCISGVSLCAEMPTSCHTLSEDDQNVVNTALTKIISEGITVEWTRVIMVSSDVSPGKRYMCFVDICTEGVQFCEQTDKRCRYCSDFAKKCFTDQQQLNCTRYCMEKWKEAQHNTFNTENGEFSQAAVILIVTLAIALSICLINMFDEKLLGGKIKQYFLEGICCCKYNKQQANTSGNPNSRYRPVSPIKDDRQEGEGREGESDDVQFTRVVGNLRDGDQNMNLHSSDPSSRLAPEILSTEVSVYQNNGRVITTLQNGASENRDRNMRCAGNGGNVSGVEHNEYSPSDCRVTGELEFDSSRNGPSAILYKSDNINPKRDTGYDTGTTTHSQTHIKTRPTMGQNQNGAPTESQRSHPRDGQTLERSKTDVHSKRNGTAVPEQDWKTLSSLTSVTSS